MKKLLCSKLINTGTSYITVKFYAENNIIIVHHLDNNDTIFRICKYASLDEAIDETSRYYF